MKKPQTPPVPMARIVRTTRDASQDYFIPLAEAKKLHKEGKLARLDMGPAYPNSYEKV